MICFYMGLNNITEFKALFGGYLRRENGVSDENEMCAYHIVTPFNKNCHSIHGIPMWIKPKKKPLTVK